MKGSRFQGCVLTLLCVVVLIPIFGFLGFIIGNTSFTEATQLGIASLLVSIAYLSFNWLMMHSHNSFVLSWSIIC
uniref:Uncharacterized protein n=1 Tax=Nelumbo nucifera TaxID=4432 RepID=A0A822YSJ9_NELNU|nr:TPA_asm: hypothetical protein HUJ06_007764 [Nelumbo nucifera]